MSFLAWLTSTPGSLLILAALIIVAVAALIWDHHAHPEPADHPADLPKRGPWTAHRPPPQPVLTPAEQAFIASLAIRYRCADPVPGRMLADYLRTKCPGVADVDLMRAVIALGHVARYFHRKEPTATEALAAYLHAMSSAALDLTALERNEIPR